MNRRFFHVKKVFPTKNSLVVPFFIILFFLSGCWDRVELNELAIVTAVAFDKSDDDESEVTLEIFVPKKGGESESGGGGGGSEQETMIMYHKGTNIVDAISKIEAELSRKTFWGSCKVFIFGEQIAEAGIENHLDYLLRYSQTRENAFAIVSEGKAKEILKHNAVLERFTAEAIRKIIDMGNSLKVTLKDLDEMVMADTQNAALPFVTLEEMATSEEEASKLPAFEGAAMFKKDKVVGIIPKSTARGLLWLRGEMKEYTITLQPDGEDGEISLFPVDTNVKLTPKISGSEWKIVVHVTTEGTIVKNGSQLNMDDPKSLKKTEKAYRKRVEQRIREAIESSQKLKVDAIHYGTQFHRKYPQKWKMVKDDWDELFPEVKTEFVIDAKVLRQGYINNSMRKEEG